MNTRPAITEFHEKETAKSRARIGIEFILALEEALSLYVRHTFVPDYKESS